MTLSRRGLLAGLVAAPAVIRVAPLMKINPRLMPRIIHVRARRTVGPGYDPDWNYRMDQGVITAIYPEFKTKELYGAPVMPLMSAGYVEEVVEFDLREGAIAGGIDIGDVITIGDREYRVDRWMKGFELASGPSEMKILLPKSDTKPDWIT